MRILTALAILGATVLVGCGGPWGLHPDNTFTFPDGQQRLYGPPEDASYPSAWNQRLTNADGTPISGIRYTSDATTFINTLRDCDTSGNGCTEAPPHPLDAG